MLMILMMMRVWRISPSAKAFNIWLSDALSLYMAAPDYHHNADHFQWDNISFLLILTQFFWRSCDQYGDFDVDGDVDGDGVLDRSSEAAL